MIGPRQFPQLIAWLEKAYPEEGCGLVLRDRDGEVRFVACANVIDRYHQVDPENYPRSARDFYMIDPREFMRADERGDEVVAIVHSHPDTGDYFSESDVEAALMPGDGANERREPIYPGTDYLVVSVCGGQAQGASLYRFDDDRGEFGRVERWDQVMIDGAVNRRAAPEESGG